MVAARADVPRRRRVRPRPRPRVAPGVGVRRATSASSREPGDYLTLQVGAFPLSSSAAATASCGRCTTCAGTAARSICEDAERPDRPALGVPVPPVVLRARRAPRRRPRSMPADVDPRQLGLGAAHCATVGGLVFVCVADRPARPRRRCARWSSRTCRRSTSKPAVVAHRDHVRRARQLEARDGEQPGVLPLPVGPPRAVRLVPRRRPALRRRARRRSCAGSTSSSPGARRPGCPADLAAPTTAQYRVMRLPLERRRAGR